MFSLLVLTKEGALEIIANARAVYRATAEAKNPSAGEPVFPGAFSTAI